MDNKSSLSGNAGGVRSMTARWVFTGQMMLETAAHFGGESDTAVDMAVLRDPKCGVPLLPGTSLAGALRSHLADVLDGYRSAEHPDVAALFGAARRNAEGSQSPLIVFDSLGELPGGMAIEIRDGVTIDPSTGTAEAHKKFDLEVLPAGTLFPVRVELIIEDAASESKLLGLVAKTLDGLKEKDIALGMRRSRGFGAVKVRNWKSLRYDLTTQEGWLGWLTTDYLHPVPNEVQAHESPWQAILAAHPALVPEEIQDNRERVLIDLALEVDGDLLVRSPASDPAAPDSVHLHSAGRPVLPGTGLAGALRARALSIARLVRISAGDGDKWIDRLFGSSCNDDIEADTKARRISASKLRISESCIENPDARIQTRIAIDRFTGGVVRGALFEEQVLAGGKINIQLELRKPTDAETGLLLLLLKDLLSGNIPVGGAASVGRGVLKGTAKILFAVEEQYDIASDLTVGKEAMERFNSFIAAFHKVQPLKSEEVRS